MSIRRILIIISLLMCAAGLRAELMDWSTPYSAAEFRKFPYRYKTGYEVELTVRVLSNIVNDAFRWDAIDEWYEASKAKKTQKAKKEKPFEQVSFLFHKEDLSLDYFSLVNKPALDQLRIDNPELFAKLTEGLNAFDTRARGQIVQADTPKLKTEIDASDLALLAKAQPARGSSQLLQGLNQPQLPSQSQPQSNPLFQLEQQLRQNLQPQARPQLQPQPQGLIVPKNIFDDIREQNPTSVDSDWNLLNNRWNNLDPEVRKANIRPSKMNRLSKTKWLRTNYYKLISGFKTNSEFIEAYVEPSWAFAENLSVTTDIGSLEFKQETPFENVETLLSKLFEFSKASGALGHFNQPFLYSKIDGGYHIHFSVDKDERPEPLAPIARAWAHLVLFKRLAAGMDVFTAFLTEYSESLSMKGSVRLVDSHRIELRDHFADPATEMHMLMQLVALPNQKALEPMYGEWMPEIKEGYLRTILLRAPENFLEIITDPGLRINVSQDQIDQWIVGYVREYYQRDLNPFKSFKPRWAAVLSKSAKTAICEMIYDRNPTLIGFSEFDFLVEQNSNRAQLERFVETNLLKFNSATQLGALEEMVKFKDQDQAVSLFLESTKENGSRFFQHATAFRNNLKAPERIDRQVLSYLPKNLQDVVVYLWNAEILNPQVLDLARQQAQKPKGCANAAAILCAYWYLHEPTDPKAKRFFERAMFESKYAYSAYSAVSIRFAEQGRQDVLVRMNIEYMRKFKSVNAYPFSMMTPVTAKRHRAELEKVVYQPVNDWLGSSPESLRGQWTGDILEQFTRFAPDIKWKSGGWLNGLKELPAPYKPIVLKNIQQFPWTPEDALKVADIFLDRADHSYSSEEVQALLQILRVRKAPLTPRYTTKLIQMISGLPKSNEAYHAGEALFRSQGLHKAADQLAVITHNSLSGNCPKLSASKKSN